MSIANTRLTLLTTSPALLILKHCHSPLPDSHGRSHCIVITPDPPPGPRPWLSLSHVSPTMMILTAQSPLHSISPLAAFPISVSANSSLPARRANISPTYLTTTYIRAVLPCTRSTFHNHDNTSFSPAEQDASHFSSSTLALVRSSHHARSKPRTAFRTAHRHSLSSASALHVRP